MEDFPSKKPEKLSDIKKEALGTEFTSENLEEMLDYIRTEEARVSQMRADEQAFRSEYEILEGLAESLPDNNTVQKALKEMEKSLNHFAESRREMEELLAVIKDKFEQIPKN